MTITREELDSLKVMVDAATEGPWELVDKNDMGNCYIYFEGSITDRITIVTADPVRPWLTEENATFIAASREAVPRLIAELERARALLQAFVRAYEKATPATEYDVVEANAYSEAAAYLIDAGVE